PEHVHIDPPRHLHVGVPEREVAEAARLERLRQQHAAHVIQAILGAHAVCLPRLFDFCGTTAFWSNRSQGRLRPRSTGRTVLASAGRPADGASDVLDECRHGSNLSLDELAPRRWYDPPFGRRIAMRRGSW